MSLLANKSQLVAQVEEFTVVYEEKSARNTDSFSFLNRISFHKINSELPNAYFLIQGDSIVGLFLFHLENQTLKSLSKSSYGGFEFSESVSEEIQLQFVNVVLSNMTNQFTYDKIQLVFAPEIYSLHRCRSVSVILDQLFFLKLTEINHYIFLSKCWFYSVKYSHRKKINQSIRSGFRFQNLGVGSFCEVYDVIKKARLRKNYPVTMRYEDLLKNLVSFSESFEIFGILADSRVISSAICIRVTKEIVYLFYMGHDQEFDQKSPNSFMIYNLTQYYFNQGFKLLDFGVSSENGIRNEGLSSFKESLGAKSCDKNYYTLNKV